MIKECPICGRVFTSKRRDAVYCSAKCRMRKRRGAEANMDEILRATDENALGLIDRAHAVAVDMSRMAMVTPMPLSGKLGRIAGKVEDALRSEGL